MKRPYWEIFLSVCCVLILMSSVCVAASLFSDRSEEKVSAEDMYRVLQTATHHNELRARLLQWLEEADLQQQEHLQTLLFDHIESTQPRERSINQDEALYDLQSEGGRCVWAFQLLWGGEFPPVAPGKLRGDLSQIRQAMWKKIKQTKVKRYVFTSLLLKAALPKTVQERQRLAEHPNTPSSVLDVLADDVDATIRLAVAQNFSTSPHVLGSLAANDTDAVVRKAAMDNLGYSRMPDLKGKTQSEIVNEFLEESLLKTPQALPTQPLILPFDLAIHAKLTAMMPLAKAARTLRTTQPGPQILTEAVEYLVKHLDLSAPPVFCTEDESTFYCLAGTSLTQGADFSSGFAIEKGGTTIYSWDAPQE